MRKALLSVVAAFCLAGSALAASLNPVDLTCEYLVNPAGLDTAQPRLSWKLRATDSQARGQHQSAWRVLVASRPELTTPREADLWDSGWERSARSQIIPYAGRPLKPGLLCYWRVRVRDEGGSRSDWSETAAWTMGPMRAGDWSADWIGTTREFAAKQGNPPPDNTMPDPWLRKSFDLDAAPTVAFLHVASVGYHEVHINGVKVGDSVLMPAVADHTKRARCVTYDITSLLQPGRNTLGLWLGASWSIYPSYRTEDKPASPIVLAQAELLGSDGSRRRIVTDGSWKWHEGPSTTLGVWNFMHYGGELLDASKTNPAWSTPDFDDSHWQSVKVFDPKLTVTAEVLEPNRLVAPLEAVAIEEPAPGVWRIDMGRVFTGWVEADLRGRPGDRIELKFSERKEQPITHRLHSTYVIGPEGKGTFRNRFNYSVGRWIQVEGLREKPALNDFRGWLARTDYARTTQFACSDPLLNRIYETTLWTFENLSLGGYVVDCAQRERMGYGGDAHATTPTGLDNYALGAFYTKWAQDWRDVQGKPAAWGVDKQEGELGSGSGVEAGNLPYTAPTYWGGGGPGWSGFCVTLPWEFARRTGDHRLLEQMLPTIEAWLAFLETKSKDDLLVRWGGQWDFLGDWLWPGAKGVNCDTRETLFFNNCYWIYNLQNATKIARALGRDDFASKWTARAEQVRTAVHREFFNPEDASYVNGFQAYLSIALLVGLPPKDLQPAVWQRLEDEIRVKRDGHFWGGITGGAFIVQNLIAAGRNDLMCLMARQQDYPGWGDMLAQGATTLWEDWEGRQSLSHSSYLHVGSWFVEGLAGIQPGEDADGFRTFHLRPACDGSVPLSYARCRQNTPYGTVFSGWTRDGDSVELALMVPPNTSATLEVPGLKLLSIEGGDNGVERLEADKDGIHLRLAPGKYLMNLEGTGARK